MGDDTSECGVEDWQRSSLKEDEDDPEGEYWSSEEGEMHKLLCPLGIILDLGRPETLDPFARWQPLEEKEGGGFPTEARTQRESGSWVEAAPTGSICYRHMKK